MSAQPVDVLAVRAAEILAESYSDRENLAIRIARLEQRDAAVAELIEASRELHDALHECWTDDESRARIKRRNVAAVERHAAALARVQGTK